MLPSLCTTVQVIPELLVGKVWVEAGCPAGILAEVKKSAKARYKYAVHRLKRRQPHIKRKKLGASRNTRKF